MDSLMHSDADLWTNSYAPSLHQNGNSTSNLIRLQGIRLAVQVIVSRQSLRCEFPKCNTVDLPRSGTGPRLHLQQVKLRDHSFWK